MGLCGTRCYAHIGRRVNVCSLHSIVIGNFNFDCHSDRRFSNAKKCSAAGRALMQLDFTHCMSILELLSTCKYPHHRRYVDSYVKAYYMEKETLEAWIIEERNKNNYSTKQFTTLITCSCVNDKKSRQKLMALLNQETAPDLNDSRISDIGG